MPTSNANAMASSNTTATPAAIATPTPNLNANPTLTPPPTQSLTLSQPLPSSSVSGGSIAAGVLLAALAAAALVVARRRKRVDRLVHIVETASLGPKRSLVVARMGDELLLLGASEGGVALLATRPAPAAPRQAVAEAAPHAAAAPAPTGAPHALEGLLARLRLRPPPPPANAPPFDALLAESVEDVELRRKLAAGRAGSVR